MERLERQYKRVAMKWWLRVEGGRKKGGWGRLVAVAESRETSLVLMLEHCRVASTFKALEATKRREGSRDGAMDEK